MEIYIANNYFNIGINHNNLIILISHKSRCILTYLNSYIYYTKLNWCVFQFVFINSCLFQNQICILYLEIDVYSGPLFSFNSHILFYFNSHILSFLSSYFVSYLPTYQQLSVICLLLIRFNKLLCCNNLNSVCFIIRCVSISLYLYHIHIHLILPYRIHLIVFILLLNTANANYNNVTHYRFISVLVKNTLKSLFRMHISIATIFIFILSPRP